FRPPTVQKWASFCAGPRLHQRLRRLPRAPVFPADVEFDNAARAARSEPTWNGCLARTLRCCRWPLRTAHGCSFRRSCRGGLRIPWVPAGRRLVWTGAWLSSEHLVVQHAAQILTVAVLGQGLRQLFQLCCVYPFVAESDFFRA